MFLNRTRQILGFDIGSHAVKFVALRAGRGEFPYDLEFYGLAELPDDSIVDGSVVQPQVVAGAIREFLEQNKVRSKHVATALSGNAVIVRRVSMAREKAEALQDSLEWEAEEHIPFDIDEVNLDYTILDDVEDSDSMDVILVAAKRDRIQEYVEVVEQAKRIPVAVDVDSFAVQNAFEFNYPDRQFDNVALLNLGASKINMVGVRRRKARFLA